MHVFNQNIYLTDVTVYVGNACVNLFLLHRYFRDRFLQICEGEVQVPGCTIMKDIAYAKANHMPPEKAVNKIQV